MPSSFTLVAPLLAVVLLTACGSSSNNGSTTDPMASVDSGPVGGECTNNPVAFSAGMHESSTGGVSVAIDSDPPVPTLDDRAHFKLTVTDKSGAPVPAGTAVQMRCLMTHGGGFSHGCEGDITVTEMGNGVYEAYPVVFTMQGPWDVTFTVGTGGTADAVTFPICIQ